MRSIHRPIRPVPRNTFSSITSLILSSLVFLVCLAHAAQAEYAIIYRTNGDRYTGVWRGGNEREYTLDLLDGQKIRVPVSETRHIIITQNVTELPGARGQEHFIRGQEFLELGMQNEAESAFRQAIHESPRFADAHYALAQLLETQELVEDAMRYYGLAAQIAPQRFQFADRFRSAADRYLQEGENLKAAEVLLTIAERFPEDPSAENAIYRAGFLFADAYDALKQQQEQNLMGSETTEDPTPNLDKAIKALQQGFMNYPQHPDAERAHYQLGVLYLQKKAHLLAYHQLTEFIDTRPGSMWLADAYLARGQAALAQRLNRDALEDFEQALRMTTDSSLARQARQLRDKCAWQTYYAVDGLPSNLIQALAIDGNTLWVGTSKGLTRFDVSFGSWNPLPLEVELPANINVYALAADDQNVWIGTLNNGLYYYNKVMQHTEQFISGERVSDIDLYGDEVWVGTFNGLRYYNTSTGEWLHMQQGLPALDVSAVTATPNNVWVGTSQSGLGVFDKVTRQWRTLNRSNGLPAPISNSIRSLSYALDRVWFTWYNNRGNGYGWYHMNQNQVIGEGLLTSDLDPLEDIFVGVADQQAWIAHNVAVSIQDLIVSDWNTVDKPTSLGRISALAVGNEATWIGTTSGLGRVDGIIVARSSEGMRTQ